jgi:hypothetical protein
MITDRDQNELARMLERLSDADFIRVIVAGHRKFRAPDCGCDICRGKFQEFEELRKAAE